MITEIPLSGEKSFIGAWQLDDTSICDDIIKYFEDHGMWHFPGMADGIYDKTAKSSTDMAMDLTSDIGVAYSNHLQSVAFEYIKKYDRAGCTGPWLAESVNIQKYYPNQGYFKWHTERESASAPNVYRHLVFMTYLNDVNDAGETEFYYQKVKFKPKKGLTLIWPSDWTHTHRGVTSPSEIKYIATGWFNFVSKEDWQRLKSK
jgi:prolyl 4-hydroxylase